MLVFKLRKDPSYSSLKDVESGVQLMIGEECFRTRCPEAVDCISSGLSRSLLAFLLPSIEWSLMMPCPIWLSIINTSHICLVYRCVCRAPSAFPGDPVTNRGRKKIGTRRTSWSSFGTVAAKCIQLGSWSPESPVIAA